MMRRLFLLLLVCSVAACSDQSDRQSADAESYDVAVADTPAPAGESFSSQTSSTDPISISLPQLAYSYTLGFRVPVDAVSTVQQSHLELCRELGPAKCQLIAMSNNDGENRAGDATLNLRVASGIAREFQTRLSAAVDSAGGRTVATNISAEDVSKDMVDARARIAQRELLVSRLTEILRTRNGPVADLVAAERSVAQAQEELDKAKGWLTELQGRVAMSRFEIRYNAVAPAAADQSWTGQIQDAFSGSGAAFLMGVRALLVLLIFLAPWLIVLVPAILAVRFLRRRRSIDAEADSHEG